MPVNHNWIVPTQPNLEMSQEAELLKSKFNIDKNMNKKDNQTALPNMKCHMNNTGVVKQLTFAEAIGSKPWPTTVASKLPTPAAANLSTIAAPKLPTIAASDLPTLIPTSNLPTIAASNLSTLAASNLSDNGSIKSNAPTVSGNVYPWTKKDVVQVRKHSTEDSQYCFRPIDAPKSFRCPTRSINNELDSNNNIVNSENSLDLSNTNKKKFRDFHHEDSYWPSRSQYMDLLMKHAQQVRQNEDTDNGKIRKSRWELLFYKENAYFDRI
ncbi:Hypothetical predicted protein [Mytilus galloprovincialis]|uniref:Uncharacterized protein n=1 Tax=Mytilus galloprovincialis TaxID=29158 RepID=A0A8B6FAR6_MYTGA|nr:Hypothetical predicted protein [Mytilus galloprovincialis]